MASDTAKEQAEKIGAVVFFTGFAVMVAALALVAVTKKLEWGARIFVGAGWIVFATMNVVTFYTGVFRWENGPVFVREERPTAFYLSAIPFCVGSMSIVTFLLIKVFVAL